MKVSVAGQQKIQKRVRYPKLSEDGPVVLEHKAGRMRGSTWEAVE